MITLRSASRTEATLLSNIFIDNYMPKANGEFVKVYIYLLRLLSDPGSSFSPEEMADRLLCTERDILRALKYWEEKGLLTLEYSARGGVTGIVMRMPVQSSETLAAATPAAGTETFRSNTAGISTTDAGTFDSGVPTVSTTDSGVFGSSASGSGTAPGSVPSVSMPRTESPAVPKSAVLTADRVKELKQNEEIIQLLYIAEQYLGKTLTPAEMKKILFFYDELKLSPDLIEYLIEYSVSRGHKSMRYIETVAMAWAQEGITTVAMAKEANSRYAKEYYTILKAMGIGSRNPVDSEVTLMNTWMHEYGFTMDLILEACSRTVLQTGQGSFQYADKILSGWKDKKVKNLEDIRLLDAEHKKRKLEKSQQQRSNAQQAKPTANNRFNNFHQREYDFDAYEKKLLNK